MYMGIIKRLIKRILVQVGIEQRHIAFPIFRFNVYSQNGEDGVIEFILKKLPNIPRFIIDIGANDGVEASNSRLLIEKYDFAGLLIEPYQPVFETLLALYKDHPNIRVTDTAVGPETSNDTTITWHNHVENLPMPVVEVNDLFERHHTPHEIGVLSIDIDGGDNEVLRAIDWQKFCPWIVIAEINSSCEQNLQEQIDLMRLAGYVPFLHIGNVFYARNEIVGELLFNWKIPLKGRFGFFLKND